MTEPFQENTTNITEASPPETRADERSMSGMSLASCAELGSSQVSSFTS